MQEDLKSHRASIRISESQYNLIAAFKGKSFNDKLSNLLQFYLDYPSKHAQMEKEIESLTKQKEQLLKEIDTLKTNKQKLADVFQVFDSMLDETRQDMSINRINKMIRQSGYRPDVAIVENIKQLDKLTGHENSLKDIKKGHKEKSYSIICPEAQETADKVYSALHEQALAMERIRGRIP